jgi:hypothetical protein
VPALAASLLTRTWSVPCGLAMLAVALAAAGWIRDGAFRRFSVLSVAAAPVWLLERAVCAWLTVYERVRYGGARYGDAVLPMAASRRGGMARWTS